MLPLQLCPVPPVVDTAVRPTIQNSLSTQLPAPLILRHACSCSCTVVTNNCAVAIEGARQTIHERMISPLDLPDFFSANISSNIITFTNEVYGNIMYSL